METTRQQKIAKQIQRDMAEIFQILSHRTLAYG